MNLVNRRFFYFAAAESILLLALLVLASIVIKDSTPVLEFRPISSWEIAFIIFICGAVYWTFHFLGHSQTGFWIMASIIILGHAFPILAHNALEWSQFFGIETIAEGDRSLVRDTTLFLFSLVLLISLHRIMGLRTLDNQLLLRKVQTMDRNRIVLNEGIILTGLIATGIVLALVMVWTASALGKNQDLLDGSPWSVMVVGGGAALVFVGSLVFWLTRR